MTDARAHHPGIGAEPLPVPRPWGREAIRARFGRRVLLGSGVVLVTVAVLMAGTRLLGWVPPAETPAQSWAPPMVLGAIGALELLLVRLGRPQRQLPALINVVTVSPAGFRPADNWAHLFRIRGAGAAGVVGLALFGALALGAGVAGILGALGLIGLPLAAGQTILVSVVSVVLGFLGVALLSAAGLSLRASRRGASFGERPAGVTVGPNAILVHAAGVDREIPWARVRSVTAQRLNAGTPASGLLDAADRMTLDGVVRQPLDIIRIELSDGEPQLLARGTSASAPELLFNVLFLAHSTPAFRAELGTTAGQQRLEAWAAGLPRR
ncbi:hypothetical protein [Leucobacter sp. M11]|uniref:hypothetical protein n=1 Tax=Leucobacter sp. M11 TaxID=2993565 RepID=UPI002D7F1FD2|nr:hypothetical protein [Leucobacter sp. M11]MEB4615227.1 hypothetical protein [Leucobacter sp. M11]